MALACYELLREQEQSERRAPVTDDPQLSFKIAEKVPDLSFRQTLLAMRSEAERILTSSSSSPSTWRIEASETRSEGRADQRARIHRAGKQLSSGEESNETTPTDRC